MSIKFGASLAGKWRQPEAAKWETSITGAENAGKRSNQRGREADSLYLDHVGRLLRYIGLVAGPVVSNCNFAVLYCADNSVPPMLAFCCYRLNRR